MDNKRHQVFVSSTFRDLTEERREVMQALLEMDCIPAGMELFPASNSSAWKLIRRVIDQSDYYVLIIGGAYGSQQDGVSFTEREYDYSVAAGKHVIPFLHQDPGSIPAAKTELNPDAREKLAAFRRKVESLHTCKYWSGAADLGGKVSRALIQAIKQCPQVGWVRGDLVSTAEDAESISALAKELRETKLERDSLATKLAASEETGPARFPPAAILFDNLARRLEMQVATLEQGSDQKAVYPILFETKDALLRIAQDIDEHRQFVIWHELKEMLKEVSALIKFATADPCDIGALYGRLQLLRNNSSQVKQALAIQDCNTTR